MCLRPPEFLSTQSLRHSIARVLSFYRVSSVVNHRHGGFYDFEMGDIDGLADFGMSDHWEHSTFNLSSLSGKGGEELAQPALTIEKGKNTQNVKRRRASCWIRSQLWFNTYRCVVRS